MKTKKELKEKLKYHVLGFHHWKKISNLLYNIFYKGKKHKGFNINGLKEVAGAPIFKRFYFIKNDCFLCEYHNSNCSRCCLSKFPPKTYYDGAEFYIDYCFTFFALDLELGEFGGSDWVYFHRVLFLANSIKKIIENEMKAITLEIKNK